MCKKLSISFVLCCSLAAIGYAEEATQPTAEPQVLSAEPEVLSSEPQGSVGRQETVNAARGGSCSVVCLDGTSLSCPSGTINCSASSPDCPAFQGSVSCDGNTIYCSASCPVSECPNTPGCEYVYIIADACCVDTLNDPGAFCPDICE